MQRDIFKQQMLVLGSALILALATLLLISLVTPATADEMQLWGWDLAAIANIVQINAVLAGALVASFYTAGLSVVYVWRAVQRRWWPRVGEGALPTHRRASLLEGLDMQKQRIAESTSWPAHRPNAAAALNPRKVHFGDAAFTVPKPILRDISRFLGRPRRRNSQQSFANSVMVITGEPGAGKSVLTQEIHSSLLQGVEQGRHVFIPLVLFASDLTLDLLGNGDQTPDTLKHLLARYFRSAGTAPYAGLADFIDSHWDAYDFLIIIDGLDEIAQRSEYESIQLELKRIVETELSSEAHRVRRILMSCRLDDDIGLFSEAQSVVLRGLRTETERIRFCDNIVSNYSLAPADRDYVQKALRQNSSSLSSVDIFRRNPYFLSMLLEYLRTRTSEPLDRVIDFEYLINKYISREVDRQHALVASPTAKPALARQELRRSLERCASIFLAHLAFHMTTTERDNALYGQALISPDLVESFMAAVREPASAGVIGPWGNVGRLLDRLAAGTALSEAELSFEVQAAYLDENDLRIFSGLAASGPVPSKGADVMKAFSVIAHEGRLETPEWYSVLAEEVARAGARHFADARGRMAMLLFARGLVAAHALRLIYIEKREETSSVRFRHRRLAEYFAASYVRDRWPLLQPINDSPWLTPVLNLVAAIEGPRCYALEAFVTRLASDVAQPGFSWRGDVTAAAEAAAFAYRGDRFRTLLDGLLMRLAFLLRKVRVGPTHASKKERRDLVSELTIINGIDFVSGLDVPVLASAGSILDALPQSEAREPSQLLLHSWKLVSAISRLAGRRPPLRASVDILAKSFREPSILVGHPWSAWRHGLGVHWVMLLLSTLLVEAAVAWVLATGLGWLVTRASTGAMWNAAATGRVAILLVIATWTALRVFQWYRSPARASRLAAGVFIFLAGALSTVGRIVDSLRRGAVELPTFSRDVICTSGPKLVRASRTIAVQFFLWSFFITVGSGLIIGAVAAISVVTGGNPDAEKPQQPAAPIVEKADPACVALAGLQKFKRSNSRSLDEERLRLSALYRRAQQVDVESGCGASRSPEQETPPAVTAVETLLFMDHLLIPVSSEAPTYDQDDYARLRTELAGPVRSSWVEGPLAGIAAFFSRQEVEEQIVSLRQAVDALDHARATGRIADPRTGLAPSRDEFLRMAADVKQLHSAAWEKLRLLKMESERLGGQMLSTFLWLCVAVPLIVLLARLLFLIQAHNRDRALFREVSDRTVPEICGYLENKRLSERLRSNLKQSILSREQISQSDIASLERAVQEVGLKDMRFAVELGAAVTDLSNRLARRT